MFSSSRTLQTLQKTIRLENPKEEMAVANLPVMFLGVCYDAEALISLYSSYCWLFINGRVANAVCVRYKLRTVL